MRAEEEYTRAHVLHPLGHRHRSYLRTRVIYTGTFPSPQDGYYRNPRLICCKKEWMVLKRQSFLLLKVTSMVLSKQTLLSLALVSAHVKIRFISPVFSSSIFHIVKVNDIRIRCMLSIPGLPAIENSRTRAKTEGHFRDASSLCFKARLWVFILMQIKHIFIN